MGKMSFSLNKFENEKDLVEIEEPMVSVVKFDTPVAAKEEDDPDKFWKEEEWDANLPNPGFITDFVYTNRGIESPTSFCVWTALGIISAALRRNAWLDWHPNKLFANLYLSLVSEPRICAKSTIINYGAKVLSTTTDYLADSFSKRFYKVRFMRNKATPEGLFDAMAPIKLTPKRADGSAGQPFDLGSQICIVAPELSTFLGKQKYNEGAIELLTSLFDCDEVWSYTNVKNKTVTLRKVFVTMLGASTPDGLQDSIPFSAFGGGFLSRIVVVAEQGTMRQFPEPKVVPRAPDKEELARRIVWIMLHGQGEYRMTAGARKAYYAWYPKFKTGLGRKDGNKHVFARYDNTLLKLCLLLRASRYSEGTDITIKDFRDAVKIMEATYRDVGKVVANVGATPFIKNLRAAEEKIQLAGKRTRRQLLTGMRWSATECLLALNQLYQEGKIEVRKDGKEQTRVTRSGPEVYIWKGRPSHNLQGQRGTP